MSKHQKKTGSRRFVQLFHWMLDSPAWKDLDPTARALYVEMQKRYNGPGTNNGRIGYSAREAAHDLKVSKDTAARAFISLLAHGFIVREKKGSFSFKVRHAAEYRLTIYDSDLATFPQNLATKEFMRWPEIQNSVPVVRPMVPVVGPIGPRSRTVSSNNSLHGPSGRTVRANN